MIKSRLQRLKPLLWFFSGMALVVAIVRFWYGLGATTALTDKTPWGLWIGLKMGGIAFAASGFVIAGTVYVFRLEKYRPILRPAVLTAFLGYSTVIVWLLFDLGLPHNIWRPMVNWQHHSALFEVSWCVMLYFTVLALEFAPLVLEKTRFHRIHHWLKRVTIPLVIFGIMLSTLHQSSLGSLMLIMPFRLHPLWYSPLLPILFFTSSVGLGLMIITLEYLAATWLFKAKVNLEMVSGLARAAVPFLALYFLLRVGDLAYRGALSHIDLNWPSILFLFEMGLSTLLPLILLSFPWARRNPISLAWCAGLVVFGFFVNRLTVSGVATLVFTNDHYVPSWLEFAISLGVFAAALLVFFFFVEHLEVFELTPRDQPDQEEGVPRGSAPSGVRVRRPAPTGPILPLSSSFDRVSSGWKANATIHGLRANSLAFILGIALTYAVLPADARHGARPATSPVHPARGGEELLIDGNRSYYRVLFPHLVHQEALGEAASCAKCHHMNNPLDQATRCAECHRDMYLPTQIFSHQNHVQYLGGNQACIRCHGDSNPPRKAVVPCRSCHEENLVVKGARLENAGARFSTIARGYVSAMHNSCIPCHRKQEQESGEEAATQPVSVGKRPPKLYECAACHQQDTKDLDRRIKALHGHRVKP